MNYELYNSEFQDEIDYFYEKYSDFEVSKLNRQRNKQSERSTMAVDGAGLKDVSRITRNRYIKKYGR